MTPGAPHIESLYARDDASVAGRAYRKSASGARGLTNSGICAEQQPPAHTNAQLGKGAWPAAMAPRTLRPNIDLRVYVDVPPFRVMTIAEALVPKSREYSSDDIAARRALYRIRARRQRAKWGLT